MFQVSVKVANPHVPSKTFEEKFWVNPRDLYTSVPEDRLRDIDITASRGGRDDRLLIEAVFTIPGYEESLTCPVVLAPPGSPYVLGATALANFGVEVDPKSNQLRPIAIVIA
ncbi:MAG: hypothetical protein DMF56_18510 [Acidobacteria bacterium]|nr:MAG: hypothetical protein DMF56_18510 [Acidobacteriota bacterium]